jgi:uncharacterized protein (AIM24 family)
MMYKDSCVNMDTIFGDGSAKGSGGGLLDKLMGAGKRILTGESLFITVFTHRGSGKAKVAFGAPFPGNIIPMRLSQVGGTIICQKDSFLCAAKGVCIGIHFQRKATAWSSCTPAGRSSSASSSPANCSTSTPAAL